MIGLRDSQADRLHGRIYAHLAWRPTAIYPVIYLYYHYVEGRNQKYFTGREHFLGPIPIPSFPPSPFPFFHSLSFFFPSAKLAP